MLVESGAKGVASSFVRKVTFALVVLVAVAAAAPSAFSGAESTRVVYRLADPPVDLGATRGSCVYGRQRSNIVSPTGKRLGRSLWCTKGRKNIPIQPIRAEEDVLVTDSLAGGKLISRATFTYTYLKSNKGMKFSATGRVVRGTGIYAGSRGTIRGSGRFVFGPRDQVRRVVTFTISLS
jgi:hypothetical protein